jgi:glycosyltransferase involved in cell wall biosynthesis
MDYKTADDRKRLLLIAFHFPPVQGSTGVTRTLAFARYLTRLGWDVTVLTVIPTAFERRLEDNYRLIPDDIQVHRAWAFDTKKAWSALGRYPRFLALPDRWQSWVLGGYIKGRSIIKDFQPHLIMSTYPLASAHLLGYLLHQASHIPWVAEFRDPMLQENYPNNRWERRAFSGIEKRVFRHADEVVVTTDGSRSYYAQRYPLFPVENISVISNGYDPEMFSSISRTPVSPSGHLVLLHSGVLYPHERNPQAFFTAIKSLGEQGVLDRFEVQFHFRGSGNESAYEQTVEQLGISDYIKFTPNIPYVEALQEMSEASALMLFQADNCNDQIPAKAYEYMHIGKPILGLADPSGDTGKLLRKAGVRSIAKLENAAEIETVIRGFLEQLKDNCAYTVPKDFAMQYSREAQSKLLDKLLSRRLEFSNV